LVVGSSGEASWTLGISSRTIVSDILFC
jgi:hypothetical protein